MGVELESIFIDIDTFLAATTHFYKRSCPSVRPSVGGQKLSNDIINNDTMSDDEVVASDVPPWYLLNHRLRPTIWPTMWGPIQITQHFHSPVHVKFVFVGNQLKKARKKLNFFYSFENFAGEVFCK